MKLERTMIMNCVECEYSYVISAGIPMCIFGLDTGFGKAARSCNKFKSRFGGKMRIAKYTSADGENFYTDKIDTDPTPEGATVEIVEMSEEEYRAIPATQQAARFFEAEQ